MEEKIKEKFNINNILRCPKCFLIPLIELINDEKQLFIKYKCENNHEEKILLEEFIKNSKMNSIYKNKCKKCQKEFDIKKKI